MPGSEPGSEPGATPGAVVSAALDSVSEEEDPTVTEAAEPGAFPTEAAVPATGPAGSEFDPVTGREDGADSAGRAASPGDPGAVSAEPDALVCSSSFIQRPRRFSRMRIDTSMGVPLKPKVSRRRRMMNRR